MYPDTLKTFENGELAQKTRSRGRLVILSNRIPVDGSLSGGLVVALHETLSRSGGLWIGAHPEPGHERGLFALKAGDYDRKAFRLSAEEHDSYYLGFSNSVLWPLFHRRSDLVRLNRDYEAGYLAVNARVARLVAAELRPTDIIWIHDYQLLPLAFELRKLGVGNRIGFFLHIPFPSLGDLSVLPNPDSFAAWLAACDLVGLQTRSDTAKCIEMFRADPRAEFLMTGAVQFGDRTVKVRSFPIGIDGAAFRSAAELGADGSEHVTPSTRYMVGVDRLDYSKGLPDRFCAYGRYLERTSDSDRPCLVQIAPATREKVAAYREITSELEEIAGHVNGLHGELDWTPIRYIHRSMSRATLAPLYRGAAACLVTSLADGMNLVAKEYVAAQDPANPGVLILSRFAGASEDMTEALLINPYDVEEISEAIQTAVTMPLEERKRRHTQLQVAVERTDVNLWTTAFLNILTCVRTPARACLSLT